MPGAGGVGLSQVRPSRAWYGLAAAILVVGGVVAVLLVVSVVKDVAGVSRFSTSRAVEADLEAGDERTIYAGVVDSGFESEPTCGVVHTGRGAGVPTTPSSSSLTLTLGEDEFRPLAQFEAERDGRHRISCSAPGVRPMPMAVGPRIRVVRSVSRVLGAIAAGLVSLALAAATIAVTAVKRHRHRRQLQGAA